MVSFLSGVCPRLSVSASLSVFPYPSSHYANLSLSLTISTGMRVPSLGSLCLSLQNKYILLWCLSMEQPTSDSLILSVTELFQA